MDEFNDMEKVLMEENEDAIGKLGLLELKDNNIKRQVCYLMSCLFFTNSTSLCNLKFLSFTFTIKRDMAQPMQYLFFCKIVEVDGVHEVVNEGW